MTYNYLATLRLHDNADGRAIVVGPMRRVLFAQGVDRSASKQDVKTALRPLEGIWLLEDKRFAVLKGNSMTFQAFRTEAKKLLVNAKLLTLNRKEHHEESAI